MERITSPHNARLKAARKLFTSRGRRQQNRIVIFGQREIQRACTAAVDLTDVFVCHELLDSEGFELLQRLESTVPEKLLALNADLFARLSFGDRQDGIIAVATRPSSQLIDLPSKFERNETWLIGVVQAVEKPGNLGAVIRSADGAGVDAVFVADPLCDAFHPNCIRASLGTVFAMPLACDSSSSILEWLRMHRVNVFATHVDSELVYYEVDLTHPSAIALGNESNGLTSDWRAENITSIHIPMYGLADSLNLSATAAIMFYECNRQRQARKTK